MPSLDSLLPACHSRRLRIAMQPLCWKQYTMEMSSVLVQALRRPTQKTSWAAGCQPFLRQTLLKALERWRRCCPLS